MIKTKKITYKVFFFERVKKKVRFFESETYPLQIRLTAGTRTLYLKSNFFIQLQQHKYQLEVLHNDIKISINDIIWREEELMNYLLNKKREDVSLDIIRQEYVFFSRDILNELDERFRQFLIDFFYDEDLLAYSLFIKNAGNNHTCEFILDNLQKSLQPLVFEKLLKTAVAKAPPYIPFIKFFRDISNNPLPVFPVYQWLQEPVLNKFELFIAHHFPEYQTANAVNYINAFIA